MKIEEKTILWKPVSEYTGGRVLATNGLDILVGELNPEGDCVSEDCGGTHLCGITHFAKIDGFFPTLKESEDEKIRKALICGMYALKEQHKTCFASIPIDNAIAWLEKQSTPQVRTGLEWVNTIDDACDKRYAEEYAHGEYCHEQSFKWGFQEGVEWLENQGEHVEINPTEFDTRLQALIGKFDSLPKEELIGSLSFWLNVVQNDGTYREEKQCEQKPADKVEPKFHKGEWIIHQGTGNIYQVVAVIDNQYQLKYGDNYTIQYCEDVDRCARLWTIQDAKNGDVLAAEDKDKIFIYNGKLDLRGRVCAYCGIYKTHDGLCFTECAVGNYFTYKEPYPATKEQRDVLMKAMADAGYTFDFEKKELKKIEPIDEYEGLTDFERTVADICIGWIGKEHGWKKYIKDNADALLKIAIEKFNSVQDATFEQKPTNEEVKELLHTEYEKGRADAISEMKNHAWSDDDEKYINDLTDYFECNSSLQHNENDVIDWLKSLKDRVQPKQEWSEEDSYMLESIVSDFAAGHKSSIGQDKWLKSLKPQNHWKPTEAQLASLTIACDRNDRIGFDLTQLLKELKKL